MGKKNTKLYNVVKYLIPVELIDKNHSALSLTKRKHFSTGNIPWEVPTSAQSTLRGNMLKSGLHSQISRKFTGACRGL